MKKHDRLFIAMVVTLSAVPLVFAATQGRVSLKSNDVSSVRVFPNPWKSDQHADKAVTFDRLAANSSVKIFTLSGQFVKSLSAPSGSVDWDRTNDAGEHVASGLYLFVVKDAAGNETTGKLAIIR